MSATAEAWNFGLCATRSREPRQARKGATVSGTPRVPQFTRSSSRLLVDKFLQSQVLQSQVFAVASFAVASFCKRSLCFQNFLAWGFATIFYELSGHCTKVAPANVRRSRRAGARHGNIAERDSQ